MVTTTVVVAAAVASKLVATVFAFVIASAVTVAASFVAVATTGAVKLSYRISSRIFSVMLEYKSTISNLNNALFSWFRFYYTNHNISVVFPLYKVIFIS